MKHLELVRIGQLVMLLIIGFVGTLLTTAWAQPFTEEHGFVQAMSRRAMITEAQRSHRIHDKLTTLCTKTGAIRACIYLFHNGPCLSTGKPMKMMSCAYESVALDVRCENYSQKALIVSRYPAVCKLLTEDDKPIIFNIAQGDAGDLDLTGQLPETRYIAMRLITCDDQIIGWLGLDFLEYPGQYNSRIYSDAANMVSRILGDSSGQ